LFSFPGLFLLVYPAICLGDQFTDCAGSLRIIRRNAKAEEPVALLCTSLQGSLDAAFQNTRAFHRGIHGQNHKLIPADAGPLVVRIFAVVDVWDALSSDRPYRKAWPEEKVCEFIQAGAGTHFNPQFVKAFLGSRVVAR
jgi:hypothetical protein